METIGVTLEIRGPAEAILHLKRIIPMPSGGWIEVGGLRSSGLTVGETRRMLGPLMDAVVRIAGDDDVYIVCNRRHGRLYGRIGFRRIASVAYRTSDDWVMRYEETPTALYRGDQ